MHKIHIGKNSPLHRHKDERRGTYWNRLAEIAKEILVGKKVSAHFVKRLAFITQALPVDFSLTFGHKKKDLYPEVRRYLKNLPHSKITIFCKIYLAHKPDSYERLSWIIPKKDI